MVLYKILIINDKLNQISMLKRIISSYCLNLEVVGEVVSINCAISEIKSKNPDIIFINISFKEEVVFELLGNFALEGKQIIFMAWEGDCILTSLSYKSSAIITKKMTLIEIIFVINKAERKCGELFFINELRQTQKLKREYRDFIGLPSLDKVNIIKISEIAYCFAEGKCTSIILFNEVRYLSSKNLGDYEHLLNNNLFFRVHRSYIINISYVCRINKNEGSCELLNGKIIPISNRRLEAFCEFIMLKC
jgi:two-component system LytT family response regulator